jgi:hypothetical protein
MSPVCHTGFGMSSVLYSMKVARYQLHAEIDNEVILDSDFVSAEFEVYTAFYTDTASITTHTASKHNSTAKDALRSYQETTLPIPHLSTPYTTHCAVDLQAALLLCCLRVLLST